MLGRGETATLTALDDDNLYTNTPRLVGYPRSFTRISLFTLSGCPLALLDENARLSYKSNLPTEVVPSRRYQVAIERRFS